MLEMEIIEPNVLEMELTGQIVSTIGGTTNYNELTEKPKINNIELEGNKTLEDLGIQRAGNYLTEIPSEYITEKELDSKDYLTEHQDISHLASKQYVFDLIGEINYQLSTLVDLEV